MSSSSVNKVSQPTYEPCLAKKAHRKPLGRHLGLLEHDPFWQLQTYACESTSWCFLFPQFIDDYSRYNVHLLSHHSKELIA